MQLETSRPPQNNGRLSTSPRTEWVWRPQPGPQEALVCCPVPEVFFGGSRGGGKTDGVLGKWALKEKLYGQHFNAIMFRRTATSAEDAIVRSREIYGPLGGKFNEQRLRWRMPNGGRVSFAYLENVQDADHYQGRNVTDAWVEEAGQFATPAPIDRLFGVLRSGHDVPVQLILTANPGGAGQHWIRERYQLYPFPRGPKLLNRPLPNGAIHQMAVIPSRISDNRYLGQDYVNRLHLVGSAQLIKAWLEGDWTAIEGAFFDCWDEAKHVIPTFAIPDHWLHFRSGDWGSFSPYSIGWWAVVADDYALDDMATAAYSSAASVDRSHGEISRGSPGTRDFHDEMHWEARSGQDRYGERSDVVRFSAPASGLPVPVQRVLPRGALVRYREDYGKVGGKLTAEQVADRIIAAELDDPKLTYGVLDPSTFNEDGGPSIAERINRALVAKKLAAFRRADNSRVNRQQSPDKRGAMGGWDQMRARLIGDGKRPMLYVFSTCRDTIRTLPVLQHDPDKAEDLDTSSEDHAADEIRYACLSRPWIKGPTEKAKDIKDGYRAVQDDLRDDSFLTM